MVIPLSFFRHDSITVARELLGKKLVFESNNIRLSGIINETEAYRGQDDPASHAYPGITSRNRSMYETYGHVYVYFIYGMHYCLNFTTEDHGSPGAVLIRSIIPLEGIVTMEQNRGTSKHLSDGPGKLCQAFGITKAQNEWPLLPDSGIYLEDMGYIIPSPVQYGKRIGINK